MARANRAKASDIVTREVLIRIQGWARDGLTNDQIATNLGISRTTLWEWAKRRPDVANALACGKEIADREVENALFKRAVGWTYEEVTQRTKFDPATGEEHLVGREIVTKVVLPDTTAIGMWLRNRKPETWRDHPESRADEGDRPDSGFVAALTGAAATAFTEETDAAPPR